MAESQEIIDYTPELLAALDRSLSLARLAPYLVAAANDRKHALQIYLWNARLSKAFLYPLNVAELTIRNAMYNAIATEVQDPGWVFRPPFSLTPESQASLARCRNRLPHNARANDLVAALTFDFWSNLFRYEYDVVWAQNGLLRQAFPHFPMGEGRGELQARVARLNKFRNRIAHHEPIHRARHKDTFNLILECLGYVDTATRDWVKAHSTVLYAVGTPPTRSAELPGLPLNSTNLRVPPKVSLNTPIARALLLSAKARPPVLILETPGTPPLPVTLEMISTFVSSKADELDGMVDLNDALISDVMAAVPTPVTATIDLGASTGDVQAAFFPPGVPYNERPQLILVGAKGTIAGIIVHPVLKYR